MKKDNRNILALAALIGAIFGPKVQVIVEAILGAVAP